MCSEPRPSQLRLIVDIAANIYGFWRAILYSSSSIDYEYYTNPSIRSSRNIYVSGNIYNQAKLTRPRLITLSLSL